MQPLLYSGAKVTCSINDKIISAGHVLDFDISTIQKEIETVDTVFPAEIAPTKIRISMNIKVYRTRDNDPAQLGYVHSPSGSAGAEKIGDNLSQQTFLRKKYITINIKDDLDQTVLFIPKAAITRRSATVAVNDLMTENWTIIGIGYSGPTDAKGGLVGSFRNLF